MQSKELSTELCSLDLEEKQTFQCTELVALCALVLKGATATFLCVHMLMRLPLFGAAVSPPLPTLSLDRCKQILKGVTVDTAV